MNRKYPDYYLKHSCAKSFSGFENKYLISILNELFKQGEMMAYEEAKTNV